MVRPDLTLRDRHGGIAAVVEVKKRWNTTADWAAQFRRNILAHGDTGDAPFFLILTPDRLYIWKRTAPASEAVPPDHVLDVGPLLAPSFERAGLRAEDVDGFVFELIAGWWLGELVLSEPGALPPEANDLAPLIDAARDGWVEYQAAA